MQNTYWLEKALKMISLYERLPSAGYQNIHNVLARRQMPEIVM